MIPTRTVTIQPYQTVTNIDYPILIISIKAQPFNGIAQQDNKPVYTFTNCRFMKIVFENNEDMPYERFDIDFIDCYIVDMEIKSITSKNISLTFLSSVIRGNLQSKNLSSVLFQNCIAYSLFLQQIPKISITYSETNIYADRWKAFLIKNGLQRYVLLKAKQNFYIYEPGSVTFETTEYSKEMPMYFRENPGGETKTSFSKREKQLLNIGLSFFMKDENESNIKIKGSYLRGLSFTHPTKGKITVEYTKVDSIYLNNFSIEGKCVFYDISPFSQFTNEHKIELHECHLDNIRFEKVSFNLYEPVAFYRTDFDGAKFVACDFPEKPADLQKFMSLQNVHYRNVQPKNFYKDQYEIFIQIKSILDKTGNFHEGLKLTASANEMLRMTDDIRCWDKIVLWINSWSNYHSLSVKRAFIGFWISSIICYLFYLNSLDRLFTDQPFDSKLIGYYFSFMDITHKLDFLVDQKKFTTGSLIFDFIGKVFIGFYIYQFVSAFRKYGKSK